MGDFEAGTPVFVESSLKYHSGRTGYLTRAPDRGREQCLVGSLTGAVASQNVTEAFTKVSLARMEIELDAQTHKLALLQGQQSEQSRKRKLVNRPSFIGRWKING